MFCAAYGLISRAKVSEKVSQVSQFTIFKKKMAPKRIKYLIFRLLKRPSCLWFDSYLQSCL